MINIWLSGFCFCGFLWEMNDNEPKAALFSLALFGLSFIFLELNK